MDAIPQSLNAVVNQRADRTGGADPRESAYGFRGLCVLCGDRSRPGESRPELSGKHVGHVWNNRSGTPLIVLGGEAPLWI